ncbi:LLM class flavin-dependent oxidoreductase [Chitinasiproducens palmae]|uniref:Alkanesulfonate monooxygenase n=1 Tax=Chitinasiproducens palmae TaxID=1770053 RepID=A0A1H2PPX7_9BURK|nr:LLM class flavin-dependent oxidoreductase [Chitinasiproducens palmae]SDV48861.1 alkanesulfonate monooxygenase [Chitinasiproducens palmae]
MSAFHPHPELAVSPVRSVRFGIWAPHRGNWVSDPRDGPARAPFALARDVVLSAERSGFDTVLFAQHTINPQDPGADVLEAWTAAAAAAALTSRIEIIAAIKPRLYHPAVLAKMALGIEDISQGRFALNVVSAWYKPELERSGIGFPEHDERYAYSSEWLSVVKALMGGEALTHAGHSFKLDALELHPSSAYRARPYIYTGGESRAGRQLASDHADCWLINGRPVEDMRPMIEDLRARPRVGAPLRFGTTGFALVRDTEALAQQELAHWLAVQEGQRDAFRMQAGQVDPEASTIHYVKQYENGRLIGANGGTIPGFVGSYDQVADRIAAFHRIGVDTFLLSFFPMIAEQERFAAEVIPRVRDRLTSGGHAPVCDDAPGARHANGESAKPVRPVEPVASVEPLRA